MIRSLPTHIPTPARTSASSTPAKTASQDFQNLLKPALNEVPHLGPFTGDPSMHPAAPKPNAPDPITSSPYLPAGYPGDTNPLNKTQHETTMNDWLQSYTKWSNDKKTQIYQQALSNWQLNDQRCQELGIVSPPKPTPPALDPIQPMPAGYWFNS